MDIHKIREIVGTTPHMHLNQARKIYRFIEEQEIADILELGFKHGVSTCYMAAALQEKKIGGITTIDLESAADLEPSIEELLEECGLRELVTIFYEPTSYTWRMMKMLEDDPNPRFDLCYIDGAHNWFVDGFAFFLADRLLRPGGWIIFDDLNWSYATSPTLGKSDLVKNMPNEEKSTAQVGKVFDLLVVPHPNYHNFSIDGDWGFAQKSRDPNLAAPNLLEARTISKVVTEQVGIGALAEKILRRLRGKNW